MSSLPRDNADSAPPVARTPTTVVDGDVVVSGVLLLFVALAFAFVHYHCLTVHRRGPWDAAGTSSRGGRRSMRTYAASGGQGVDPVVLQALPLTLFHAKDFAEVLECAVCLAELFDGEAARFLPKCGHGFHAECVDLWLFSHPTCPLYRVDIDKTDASPTPSAPLALPPVLPEPTNYATNLPTNVLFWGSQDAVTTARTVGAAGGPSSPGGVAVLVVEVPETTAPVVASREGDAAKWQGLARTRSLRRLWSIGRHEVGASSTRSCGGSSGTSVGAHTKHGTGVALGDLGPLWTDYRKADSGF